MKYIKLYEELENGSSKEHVNVILNQVKITLTDLSEGYLNGEFDGEDPEASVKSEIDGLLDFLHEVTDRINTYY